MNGYVGQNTKTVEEFIEHIRERIIAAANNWKEIAAAFGEAKEMYGFDSDTFKQLCKATKFSKSKASKLATIATSERLKKYGKELAAVQSWTVMYEITTLKDDEFERLLKNRSNKVDDVDKAEVISSGMVRSARKIKVERSAMRVYATVYVDIEAIRTEMMDGDAIEALETALRNIQTKVPYVKIDRSNVCKDEQDEYLSKLRRAFEVERRIMFNEEVDKMFERRMKSSSETREQYEKRVLGQSKASVMQLYAADAQEAFRFIGCEYDEGELYSRANSRVSKSLAKVKERVAGRGDAFVHANAAFKEIKEAEDRRAAELEALSNLKMRSTFNYKSINKEIFKDFK